MFGYKRRRRYPFCQTQKKAAVVMERVEDLQTELYSLKAALRKMDRNPPEGRKVVFTPKQRKLEKYSGRPGETYATVYKFVEEFQRVLRTRPASTEEQVELTF